MAGRKEVRYAWIKARRIINSTMDDLDGITNLTDLTMEINDKNNWLSELIARCT